MVEKANIAGKPFITSSHMLESMATSSKACRADVSDVSCAVIDGSDCVMLSSRATKGPFMFEALDQMVNCCLQAEQMSNYKYAHYRDATISQMMSQQPEDLEDLALPKAWMRDINDFFERDDYKIAGHVLDAGMRVKFAGAIAATAASPFLHLAI